MEENIVYYDYDNPTKLLKKSKQVESILQKLGFTLFLNGGTLLGSVRDDDLLKHDDDLDFFYIATKDNLKEVLDEFNDVIAPALEKKGWFIKPISWTYKSRPTPMMGQFHIIKDNISLDIWVGWFNSNGNLNVTMALEDAPIKKDDIFPAKIRKLRGYKFNVSNNYNLHVEQLYGKDWRIPDSTYKIPTNKNYLQKNILKIIDQYGWAYYFIAKEQQKYSFQNITYEKIANINAGDIEPDIVYFHSPGMGLSKINSIISKINRNKTKIIGAYGGESNDIYKEVDVIVTISFPHLFKLKKMYPNKPVIFLPEALDTEYFKPRRRNFKQFKVGYVGRPCKVKRMHILDQIDAEVATHTEWGQEYFYEGRTLDSVKKFYNSIDCLVLTSKSECMPRVVLEAMSMGLPVISTDVGCLRMLIEPEWIVPNSGEGDIVKNINDRIAILKKYPKIRSKVSRRNREYIINNFNWRTTQPIWDNVFNALAVNDIKKVKVIGDELENKWMPFYKGYEVVERTDIVKTPVGKTTNNKVISCDNNNSQMVNYNMAIKLLEEKNIKYCLLLNTCYDAIHFGKFTTNLKNIFLGLSMTVAEVNKLKYEFAELNVIVSSYLRRTKSWGKWYQHTNVPIPVVEYLKEVTSQLELK